MADAQKQPSSRPELPKQYKPSEHEPRVRERWEASRAFHADPARVLQRGSRPYAILIPPPNVTARLHLGHALNNTLQDVLARAHRMMGYETLWMPGTDHAGIATQTVVEKRVLAEEGKRRTDFKREEFVGKIQSFKDDYEAQITDQLKRMGCSCDWDRQRFTMDEVCARAVNEAFFRLFKDGLIYRGKRLVNWDPVTQTALADDEVEMEEVDGKFYYLRYPLVHGQVMAGLKPGPGDDQALVPATWSELRARGYPVPEGPDYEEDRQAFVTVATTRPETYLGDTAVAINPRDPRAKPLRGLLIELPIVGRVIPIIEDDYVVMPRAMAEAMGDAEAAADAKAEFATGFLKVTPAHDPNDYELGRKHDLAIINIFAPDASISDKHGWADLGDAHLFVGKSREEARKLVVKEFQARNLVEDIKPYRHSVGHSYRSHAAIEPYLSDQWYVKVTDPRLRDAALRAMADDQKTTVASMAAEASAFGGAGVPPAEDGGAGVPPAERRWNSMPVGDTLRGHYRRLPHFQKGGSTYFVTFRLASGTLSEPERQLVLDSCMFWHQQRARIHIAVVMPDHVHLLLTPLQEREGEWWQLGQIMDSIKSFTAHAIKTARGDSGQLWQDEFFDRIVRDADEFAEKWTYILENPQRKGLVQRSGEYPFIATTDVGYVLQHATEEFRALASGERGGRDARPTTRVDPSAGGAGVPPAERPPGDGALRIFPERYARTYENWHVNIRDWCISRQLWWGHQIPVWSKSGLTDHEADDACEDLRTTLTGSVMPLGGNPPQYAPLPPARAFWFKISEGESFAVHACLVGVDEWCIRQVIEKQYGFSRDPDVLDTWFSSALWPISTMGWPDASGGTALQSSVPGGTALQSGVPSMEGLLQAFNPSSVLCTAREIITLWVSRMVMFNRYFRGQDLGMGPGNGPLPFRDVFIHAMIMDGEGRKMSKSLGNGVDPLDIIDSHGSDAMRFVLCQMTTQTQDVRMPVERDATTGKNTSPKFDVGRNFANKLWNASRFAITILESAASGSETSPSGRGAGAAGGEGLPLADRWMLSRLLSATKQINASLESYQFSDYATALYDLLWRDFCDWYLEAIKPTVGSDPRQRAVLAHTLETIIRLLHPIAPFITESIFERLREIETDPIDGVTLGPSRTGGLLATAAWPILESHLEDRAAEADFERVRSLVTAVREVRAQHNVPPKRRITLHLPESLLGQLGEGVDLVRTLAGLEAITAAEPSGGSVAFTSDGAPCRLSNLADAVDAGAERARLEKLIADREKTIATFQARLANPGYADKAPPHMVQQTRDQLAKAEQDRDAAAAQLRGLGA